MANTIEEPVGGTPRLRARRSLANVELIGVDWNMTVIFPFSWEFHHPN